MKTKYFMMACLILISAVCYGQSVSSAVSDFRLPAYYESLKAYNGSAKSDKEELDKQKFPYDPASAEKRLSLKPMYLEGVTLDDFKIPDPPANSSEQTRAELNYLMGLQDKRSDYEVQASLAMAGIFYNPKIKPEDSSYHAYRKNLFHIGRSIGNWFSPENMPATADLMANVWRDASYFIWGFKYKYLRVRPYVLEPALENLEDANWAAYPSGHATNSYVNAYIFSKLSPEHSEIFLRDAYDMAHSREILGVHFPSDSESGRILARQFVDKLFKNKKFLVDFEKAKAEWTTKPTDDFIRPAVIEKASTSAPSCSQPKTTTSSCAKKCQ
jgi:acid phosphatase (class A)